VLDTNILLVSIPTQSTYRPIFDALRSQRITLLVTQDILLEYEEIIGQRATPAIALNIINMLHHLANVEKKEVFYYWNLITADPDDNKFVDCAIAGAADCIVTNDRHFEEVKKAAFLKITVLNADELLAWCRKAAVAGKN
jgi:putative PIN family toxin of toxin-antitoxin system